MRKILNVTICLVLLSLVFCAISFADRSEGPRKEGAIIYKVKEIATAEQKDKLQKLLSAYEAKAHRKLEQIKVDVDLISKDKQGAKKEEDICAELIATGAVEFAEPDYLIPPELLPNDPKYSYQWFHTKINSPGAWDITTGNPSIIAAVCDTGIESSHPDLAGNLILPGYNSADGSTNTEPVYHHGTSVAGCISAIGNNGLGVSGVAWSVKILPIRVTNNSSDGSAYYSDIAEGIQWAADYGAKIINLSYGAGGSSTIDSVAQYARSKGALLFVSAGNEAEQVIYPDFASFVLVAATNSSDVLTSWSNYGIAIDIVAPGANIYTTSDGGSYGYWSGTSFSSPIAAGLATLIYSLNPSYTPEEVENFIFSTCVDLGVPGDDNVYGHGRINAQAAVYQANTGNIAPTAVMSASPTSGFAPLTVNFDGSGSYDPDGTIVSYNWDFGDSTNASGITATHTYVVPGTFNAKLTVTDNLGASSFTTTPITVQDPNTIAAPSNLSAQAVSSTQINLNWQDNSNNESGFKIERGRKHGNSIIFSQIATVGANVTTYSNTGLSPNTWYYYRVRAYNAAGNSSYSNTASAKTFKR